MAGSDPSSSSEELAESQALRALGALHRAPPEALAALQRFRREHLGQAPSRVGRYRLGTVLGSGGMGVVFEAIDEKLGREVAIKLFRAGAKNCGQRSSWLRREARALAKFSDPHIVGVFDFGVLGTGEEAALPPECLESDAYLVMERIHGDPLSAVANRFTSWADLGPVCRKIAEAVARAHELGIVHGDIKPANVLVTADGIPKVVDFGLATMGSPDEAVLSTMSDVAIDGQTASSRAFGPARSRARCIAGTPAYMAPELHLPVEPNAATDQYALCCTIFEMVYGRRPFAQQTLDDLVRAKRIGRVDWSSPRFALPRPVRRALARGLDPSPENRYPSLRAFIEAIERRSARWPSALAAIAATAIVAGATWTLRGPMSSNSGGGSMGAVIAQLARNVVALRSGNASCDEDSGRLESAFHASSTLEMNASAARLATALADLMLVCTNDRSQALRWLRQAETHLARGEPTAEASFRVDVLGSRLRGDGIAERIRLYESRRAELSDAPMERDEWADITSTLASLYDAIQRHDEALPLAHAALSGMQQDHGVDDLRTARARTTLAVALYWRAEYETAITHMRDSLRVLETELGAHHRDVLRHKANLATFVLGMGRRDEALELFEEVLEPLRDRYGAHHNIPVSFAVNAAVTMTTLAVERGDVELGGRAEHIIRAALVDDEVASTSTERDRRLGSRMYALGFNLLFQGRLSEADEVLMEAARMLAVAPEDAAEQVQARYYLARTRISKGDAAGGVVILDELLEADHLPAVRNVLVEELVLAHIALGRFDRARELFETLPSDHFMVGRAKALSGALAAGGGRHPEALARFDEALAELAAADAPHPLEQVRLHTWRAESAEALGRAALAHDHRVRAREICARVQAPNAETCERIGP